MSWHEKLQLRHKFVHDSSMLMISFTNFKTLRPNMPSRYETRSHNSSAIFKLFYVTSNGSTKWDIKWNWYLKCYQLWPYRSQFQNSSWIKGALYSKPTRYKFPSHENERGKENIINCWNLQTVIFTEVLRSIWLQSILQHPYVRTTRIKYDTSKWNH